MRLIRNKEIILVEPIFFWYLKFIDFNNDNFRLLKSTFHYISMKISFNFYFMYFYKNQKIFARNGFLIEKYKSKIQ